MKVIPKEILDRCKFKSIAKDDPIKKIVNITPTEPCEACGRILTETRRVQIAPRVEPIRHMREYCYNCKLVSIAGTNDFHKAHELNAKMRALLSIKDK